MKQDNNRTKYRLMKLRALICGMFVIFTFVSCENFINVDQPDIIEQEQAFNDKNSTRLSINGIYGLMTDLVEPMFLAGEVRADLVVANKSAYSDIKEFSNNSFSASNAYISPKPFYSIINNTNDFINQFEKKLVNMEMDSVDFYKYKSELVAIRVWSQYQIAKIFGTCKYYNKDLTLDSTEVVEYAYEDTSFIRTLINDLAFSDTIPFTTTTDDTKWQLIRFSDFYVNALMGELYMELGDYKNAISKFDEVQKYGDLKNKITGRFKMNVPLDTYLEYFYSEWETSELTNSALFMIAFDNKYNQTNDLWSWTSSLNYQVAPADWFYDDFSVKADADEENFDTRIYSVESYFADFRGKYAISKYQENDRPFILSRTERLSLLKAYCYNADNNINKAITEYDISRKKNGFSKTNKDLVPEDAAMATLWLEDLIVDELAYETGFEGQRWFDLMRVAKRRNDPSYLAKKVAQKYPPESKDKVQERLMNTENWFVPIFE